MSWGPLRFVDSMNVFPTSLASMIDDFRACAHKQLPELFPLSCSCARGQRRTHCDLEQAWDCILRKLPMPFELLQRRGVGEACGVGAALLRQRAGGESGERGDVMHCKTLREFHDCYLHTDVLADVMESYRDSFRAQSGLDPSRCPEPPGTPCCDTQPARLPFTSSPTSKPTRTCGPCGRAELHLPAVRSE